MYVCILMTIFMMGVVASPSSVDISYQYGVTITSAVVAAGPQPSEHFRYILNPYFKNQNNNSNPSFYKFSFPEQACSVEMLGYTNVKGIDAKQGRFTIMFPLRADGLGVKPGEVVAESEEQAHISFSLDESSTPVRLRCYCQQIQSQFGVQDHRVVHRGAVVYFCPVTDPAVCARLDRHERAATSSFGARTPAPLNVSLTTAYRNTDGFNSTTRQTLQNSFVMLPLPALPSSTAVGAPDTAVCSVINYGSGVDEKHTIMSSVSQAWLRHYTSLGMRVMLFDLIGQLREPEPVAVLGRLDYFNYTVFGKLGRVDRTIKHDPTWTRRNSQLTWLLDSDKMATLTHCRFEARAVHGLLHVLVVDTDEFVLCNPDHNDHTRALIRGSGVGAQTYAAQRLLLRDLVGQSQANSPGGEISLSQNVPYKITEDHIRDCIGNATAANRSIFTCIASQKHVAGRSTKLRKHLHTSIMCPWTNFHNACLYHKANIYNCFCHITYIETLAKNSNRGPTNVCDVIHFEFKTVNKYKTNVNFPMSELVQLQLSSVV